MDILRKLKERARATLGEGPRPVPGGRPHHLVVVTLDSCRFDSFVAARPKVVTRLGALERRFSYASWTAPAHYNLLMGLMPHSSPTHVYASECYKKEFLRYDERLGVGGVEFRRLVPDLYLPSFLKRSFGYRNHALVSLPVLNPHTVLNRDFDVFRLMDRHNDMRAMVRAMTFPEDAPSFWLLNVGETHYPYALPDEPPDRWPRISGVHGVFKHMGDHPAGSDEEEEGRFFDVGRLDELRARQVEAVRYLDGVFEELFDLVPPGTWITVTADHGELFGEGGYFGHGPIQHEKVFEVPFLEGKLR